MNIDSIILIILGVFLILGLVRGLIKQVGSLVGFFLSLWVASVYFPLIAVYIKPSLSQFPPFIAGNVANIAACIILFYGTGFVFGIFVAILDKIIHVFRIPLVKLTNRLGGAAIGVFEGILLIGLAIFILKSFPVTKNITDALGKSSFVPIIEKISFVIQPFLNEIQKNGIKMFQQNVSEKDFFDLKNLPKNLQGVDINALQKSLGGIDLNTLQKSLGNIDLKSLPPEIQKLLQQNQQPAPTKK